MSKKRNTFFCFLFFWSNKDGQRFQKVLTELSNHRLCGRPPMSTSFTFSSCLCLYLANNLLTASWYLELSRMPNYANTLPSICINSYVPMGSPSRGGDVAGLCLFFFLFCSCVSSVFMALSTVFHSINSPNNSPLSHSVLPVLLLSYWSFQLYICLWKPPSALI